MIKVAFDIDDTLWRCRYSTGKLDQVPDFDLLHVLMWFVKNGDDVIVWSAGGVDYAQQFVRKMGIDDSVRVIRKGSEQVDLAFDDQEVNLGKANVLVFRDHSEEIDQARRKHA